MSQLKPLCRNFTLKSSHLIIAATFVSPKGGWNSESPLYPSVSALSFPLSPPFFPPSFPPSPFTLMQVNSSILLFWIIISQVLYGWRKTCIKFMKRMDPQLLFYYHLSNDRFHEGPLSSFDDNTVSNRQQRQLPRVPQQEQFYAHAGR